MGRTDMEDACQGFSLRETITWHRDGKNVQYGHCDAVMQMEWWCDGCESVEYKHNILIR